MRKNAKGQVSVFAERVLRKLRAGNLVRINSDDSCGGYRIDNLVVPAALADELRGRDLVKTADGTGDDAIIVIADIGLAYLDRRDSIRKRASNRGRNRDQNRPGPFAAQHQVMLRKNTIVDGKVGIRSFNIGDTPLGWLLSRKGRDGLPLINHRQFEAGERLRRDFDMAGSLQGLVQSYDGLRLAGDGRFGPAGGNPAVSRIAAKQRFENALAGVGPGLSGVVERVCCHLEGLEQAERGLGWPTRSGKVILLIGLDRLADHYRLPPSAIVKKEPDR